MENEPEIYTMDLKTAAAMLPERPEDSHKGTFGRVLLVAGSRGMAGAAYLAGCAAYRTGAGLVRIYTPESNRSILQQLLPEAIISVYEKFEAQEVEKLLRWADVACIGPGVGMSPVSEKILKTVLNQADIPCIIDADAINILAAHPGWLERLERGNYVLTPHMLELSRLTGIPVPEIKKRRTEVLNAVTERYKVTLVQKDSRTMTGGYKRRICVNSTGNAAMAKAGSGDVLAGIITGLMAQGKGAYEGAALGVYLHGLAGDIARDELGRYSVLARDLTDRIASAIQIVENGKADKT